MKWHWHGKYWQVHILPYQWFFGIWWWPVLKDLAFGLHLGPLQIQWLRDTR